MVFNVSISLCAASAESCTTPTAVATAPLDTKFVDAAVTAVSIPTALTVPVVPLFVITVPAVPPPILSCFVSNAVAVALALAISDAATPESVRFPAASNPATLPATAPVTVSALLEISADCKALLAFATVSFVVNVVFNVSISLCAASAELCAV